MEVFIHNLPAHLTENGLNDQLDPVMERLRITNYQSGWEHFLAIHGHEPLHARSGAKSRLQLIGSDVYCMPSKKVKDYALRNLQYVSDQRGSEIYEDDMATSFQLFSYSCGYCKFIGEDLSYVPEIQWPDPGVIKFKKRNVIVKLDSKTLSSFGTVTLTLSSVPLFFSDDERNGQNKRSRLCSLSPDHATIAGHCLVYHFKVSPIDHWSRVQQLKGLGISITHYGLVPGGGEVNFATFYRDLPSKLSSGDLDGDKYNIIWDPEAMPTRTFAPADYPRVEPVSTGRPVETEDIADFFIDFMKTDHVGKIAVRHMILADQREGGTSHPDCKKLAELHSTAVDFSKTGIPARMEELPRAEYRPDFLATGPQTRIYNKSDIMLDEYVVHAPYDEDEDSEPRQKFYRSEKILDKLYRAVDERKIRSEDVQFKRLPDKKPFWDEFIVAMTIMNKTGAQTNRQRDHSTKLKEEFERNAGWITGLMRRDRSRPLTGYEGGFDSLELCLACVHVGGQDHPGGGRRGRREGWYGRLESFRVVAACALLVELDYFEKGLKGGGFVGVQSGMETFPSGVEEFEK